MASKRKRAKKDTFTQDDWEFPAEKDRMKPADVSAPYWCCLCITKEKDYQYCVVCYESSVKQRWKYSSASGVCDILSMLILICGFFLEYDSWHALLQVPSSRDQRVCQKPGSACAFRHQDSGSQRGQGYCGPPFVPMACR